MRAALIVLVGSIAAACATPAPVDSPAAAAQADKICKRVLPTGSNMPQRVCHTEQEWAAIEKQDQQGVDDFDHARRETNTLGQ